MLVFRLFYLSNIVLFVPIFISLHHVSDSYLSMLDFIISAQTSSRVSIMKSFG